MATLPKTNLRQVYHVACTLGEVVNGHLETRLSKLCTSSKINKWAKYKPVRYNFTNDRPANWWKAQDNSCGLDMTSARLSNAADYEGMVNKSWGYFPPRGGENEPFRLGDFAGYNHQAAVQYVCAPPAVTEQQRDLLIPFYERYDEGTLTFLDLEEHIGVDGLHIGCVLKYENYVQYGSANLAGGGDKLVSMRLGANFPASATCDLYIFLANQGVSGSGFPGNTLFYAYPDGNGVARHYQIYIKPISTVTDIYEITEWLEVETSYNWIRYSATVERTDGMPVGFDSRNFRFSYTLTTEYGEVLSEKQHVPTTNERPEIDVPSPSSRTCTISGIIYLDNNIRQAYTGTFVIEYYTGQYYDALGGIRVDYSY